METILHMLEGFGNVLAVGPLIAIALGVFMGILVGAMPGLSPSMGVALLLPFTFRLDPLVGLVMLTAVYLASNYGGSITAVTINTPGTPSAVATAFDGYPLTQQGKAGIGLGHSLVSSVVGGFVGILILILFAQPLAKVAVRMHPAEYFALALFGLTTVASLGGKNWTKAFVAALIGLLINTVGIDPISSVKRYTFGVDQPLRRLRHHTRPHRPLRPERSLLETRGARYQEHRCRRCGVAEGCVAHPARILAT